MVVTVCVVVYLIVMNMNKLQDTKRGVTKPLDSTQRAKKIIDFETITEFPEQTGAEESVQDEEDVIEGELLNRLRSDLPITKNGFRITTFDYKTAKFQVEIDIDYTKEVFDTWFENSEYHPHLQNYFHLK